MTLYGRMECPGCTKVVTIYHMDDDGNPIFLYDHRDRYREECPVGGGNLLRWHQQRMKDRIVEVGEETSQWHPPPAPGDDVLPANPTEWLASLGS